MARVWDFFMLSVPQYIPMAITSLLVGAVLATGAIPGIEFLLAAVVVSLVTAGFNSFNAIADIEIDRINKVGRPLPSKRITRRQALIFSAILYSVALFAAFFLGLSYLLITLIAIALTISYSLPRLNFKRKFFFGTFLVTFYYAVLCPLWGWALYPSQSIPFAMISFLFFIGFGLAVTKDFMDILGDSSHGADTFPVKIGAVNSKLIVTVVILLSFAYLAVLGVQEIMPKKYLAVLVFLPLFLGNVLRYDTKTNRASRMFNINVILIMFVELAISVIAILP